MKTLSAFCLIPLLLLDNVYAATSESSGSSTETAEATGDLVTYTDGTSKLTFFTGTRTQSRVDPTAVPTGSYQSYGSQITLTGEDGSTETLSMSVSGTFTFTGTMTTPGSSSTANITQSSTAAKPTNTQPCNGYTELCTRKYSNITYVGAHNSPFNRPGNSASNQALDVTTQLDNGVRFLQAQIQFPANSSVPHFCHTSCDLLDAGPITDWLGQVNDWVTAHPYDVVTILLGNGNYSKPSAYASYIESTGITKWTYEPPYLPMKLHDWPMLQDLIIRGKRVIMFMDYEANQTAYPWLLDEFSQIWETPFDPTDNSFPCTVQRPPNLAKKDAQNRLYLMNHNLNVEYNVFDISVLVPAVSALNRTNAADGTGSVGLAANNCRSDWGRAPNVLNVDYFNYGSPPGSVFEAAARVNNVTYNWSCCKIESAAQRLEAGVSALLLAGFAALWML